MPQLSDPAVIRQLLARHNFHFSKKLGQHFLTDPTVCPRMAEACGAGDGVGVLEIGPGFGVLTQALAARAEKVVAIELDHRLLPVLAQTLADCPNVKVVEGDALAIDLAALLQQEFAGMRVAVCANLPYFITSPVVMKLLESALPIENATLMLQKEAAIRIAAAPGSRESGAISAAVHYYAQPEILFAVGRESFMPPPAVDSAVIRLTRLAQPPVAPADRGWFFHVIRAAFGQRRKTLANALSAGLELEKPVIQAALAAAALPALARAEELTLADFCRLADALGSARG